MDKYFVLGTVAGTAMTRYAVLDHGCIADVVVSRPEGQEVPRPAVIRWKHKSDSVTVKEYLFNNPTPTTKNGEQVRRPTWSRAGRRAAKEAA